MEWLPTVFSFALALISVVGLVAVLCARWKYRWVPVGVYILIYLPFSLMGRFETVNHGGMDWRREWMPLGLAEPYQRKKVWPNGKITRGRSKGRLTYAGNLFWPLIVLDNLIWHRTHQADLGVDQARTIAPSRLEA